MPKLILIKHASPEVIPGQPPETWKLSDKGRQSCVPLAEKLAAYSIAKIFSSSEPKAIETAELVATKLGITTEVANDLFEHDRSDVPHMRSGEFISAMEQFFRRPDELVLGKETASECEQRFDAAIKDLLTAHAGKEIAVVSHGTVLALFLAKLTGRSAFLLWREFGLPSFAVLDLDEMKVLQTVPQLA